MKRFSAFVLCITMLFGILPTVAAAEDSITWSFDEASGVLTVSGSGDMPKYSAQFVCYKCGMGSDRADYHWEGCPLSGIGTLLLGTPQTPWREYNDSITSVIVEKNITSICDGAFMACNKLTRLTAPLVKNFRPNQAEVFCIISYFRLMLTSQSM